MTLALNDGAQFAQDPKNELNLIQCRLRFPPRVTTVYTTGVAAPRARRRAASPLVARVVRLVCRGPAVYPRSRDLACRGLCMVAGLR